MSDAYQYFEDHHSWIKDENMLTRMTRTWLPALAILIGPSLARTAEPVEITFNAPQEAASDVEAPPAAEAPAAPAAAPAAETPAEV